MKIQTIFAGALALAATGPALAQEEAPPKDFTVNGTVGVVSDYRFRGVSQSDEDVAVQGGITVTHKSGFYVGTWGSNLAGWGTFGGSNLELDVFGGFKTPLGENATLDVGLLWYFYPGGADETDFAEPYVKLSGKLGPVNATAGVAYAPKQQALGRWYFTGADAAAGVFNDPGDKEDNIYVWTDVSYGIGETGITAKGHVGYSEGNSGLGPNATSVSPTGEYFDWLVGLDYTTGPLTFGVAYVDTDISRSEAAYLQPSFSRGQDGTGSIADGAILLSITAAF